MKVQHLTSVAASADVFMIVAGDAARRQGLALAESLRTAVPGLRLQVNLGGGSFKAQFKRADRSGADLALILGEQELADQTIAWKPMRDPAASQERVAFDQLAEKLKIRFC